MALTGLGFAGLTAFWPLMIVAVAGTLNPSSGDVSVFLPTEQAALAHTVGRPGPDDGLRLVQPGRLAGGGGRRARERPARLAASRWGVALLRAERGVFVFYAALRRGRGGRLRAAVARAGDPSRRSARRAPLAESRADRAAPGGAVQPRLVRRRLRRAVAAGAVALPALPPRRAHDRRRVLRRRRAERVLAGALAAGRRAHRPDPDDGLHAPAREPVPDPRRR